MRDAKFRTVAQMLTNLREIVVASAESWDEGEVDQLMDLTNSIHNELFERLPAPLIGDGEDMTQGPAIMASVRFLADDPRISVDSVSRWLERAISADPVVETCVAEFAVEELEPDG
jgi:hypothetical protein